MHSVVSEYQHSTLNNTATYSSHSSRPTAQYEAHVAGQRNLDVYMLKHFDENCDLTLMTPIDQLLKSDPMHMLQVLC